MVSATATLEPVAGRHRHRPALRRLALAVNDGALSEVLADCETLLAEDADHPAALYGLGIVAVAKGEHATALRALGRAHEREPEEAVFAEALAILHARAGDLASASYFAKMSAALGLDREVLDALPAVLPSFATALETIDEAPFRTKAERLVAMGEDALAVQAYEQHLGFFPHDAAAVRSYAEAQLRLGQEVKAAAALGGLHQDGLATALDLSLLGEAFARIGEAEAAQGCHEAALALDPADPVLGCAMLRDAVWAPGADTAALTGMCRAWGARVGIAETVDEGAAPSDRPLRIGFLLSGWRDRRDFDVVGTVARLGPMAATERFYYGRGEIEHPSNTRLRDGAAWRDVTRLDPLTLAAVIRGDEVDVLVDIGGHAAPAHLLAMAQQPAPKLVSWLGNPVTLGLEQLDVELVEEPDAEGDGSSGGPRRRVMPHGLYAFASPDLGDPSAPNRTGAVVFGADVALPQLHPDLLAAWAAILERTPGSVLALRDQNFAGRGLVDVLVERFAAVGVADRIDVIAADAPAFWPQVDIALAPFMAVNPHDAAAALGQGVPVVALAGAGRHRRQASALLAHAGLGGEVAPTVERYCDRAVLLAQSAEARTTARAAVRQAVETSAVFDPARFAAAFHAALADIARSPR